MALQNFEQLNSMSTKWYDKMNIPQEEKKKRVDLSLMYAEIFDMWLTLIVTAVLSQQNASTWLEERLKVTAENYIGKEDIAYINDWSKKEAEKVTKVTFRNLNKSEDQEPSEEEEEETEETEKRTIDFQELDISVPKDEYWTSEERGLLLGIECATITANYEDFLKGTEDGKTRKVWITEADDKVRDTHSEVHGEDIPINDYFLVGNSYMLFPGDISAGAEDKEIINCRCWCIYIDDMVEKSELNAIIDTNERIKEIENERFYIPRDVGAAFKKFYVDKPRYLRGGKIYLKPGTYVTGVKVILEGKKIKDIDRLIETYLLPNGEKTQVNDWFKVRGRATVTDGKEYEEIREVHWYQASNVGKVDFKFPSNENQR